MGDHIPEEEKIRRLGVLNEHQRAIQIRRNSELIGRVEQVHVEGRHQSLGQWVGRTSQNRTLNFTDTSEGQGTGNGLQTGISIGNYLDVRVTRAGPHSLVGESVFDNRPVSVM